VIGLGRALDLVLTGRPVPAAEALAMGLVNRVVPRGAARAAAEELARQIASFPQAGVRGDRLALLDGLDGTLEEAMRRELDHGRRSLEEGGLAGAARFTAGEGRHGKG
jgi:enoyl-CoA hydratase